MKVKKFRVYVDLDSEENWLNKMSDNGFHIIGKGITYEFIKRPRDKGVIKIDYRIFKSNEEFENYVTLFEDCGWRHIAGTKSSGKQYFKQIFDNSEEDIFSDRKSKADRYKRLSEILLTLITVYIIMFISVSKYITIKALINPKLLYYTTGLWQRTGVSFWSSFIFETPFAVMRGLFMLFFPCMIILFIVFYIKAKIFYKSSKVIRGNK